MTKTWFLILTLLSSSVFALEQQILPPEPLAGILRRFNVSGKEHRRLLNLAQIHDLDVWNVGNSFIDVYSPPTAASLPDDLQEFPHSASSVPRPLSRQQQSSSTKWNLTVLDNSTFHAEYHPLPEINTFLREIALLYPNVTRLTRLGLSAEGRDMFALTIFNAEAPSSLEDVDYEGNVDDGNKKRKKKKKHPEVGEKLNFVITGAQHAREWIATATSLYVAHALVTNNTHAEPHGLSSLLKLYNFHIIPVPNPDGYTYTWKKDRYWYKNRQVITSKAKCVGLDMNRNWGYKWRPEPVDGAFKPSKPIDPCSHWYPGSRPFEAPETNNLANFFTTLPDVVAFIDLRSYGQMLSFPYSYSCRRIPKDAEDQAEAAFGALQAIHAIHGAHFETGRLCENLYEAPGNIVDWMYTRGDVKYSYAAHLRDTGTYGFSLPQKWIRPVGEETAGMVKYLAKFIAERMNRKL